VALQALLAGREGEGETEGEKETVS